MHVVFSTDTRGWLPLRISVAKLLARKTPAHYPLRPHDAVRDSTAHHNGTIAFANIPGGQHYLPADRQRRAAVPATQLHCTVAPVMVCRSDGSITLPTFRAF